MVIGLLAGVICAWAVSQKYRLGFDDSLDVVGVHGIGGLVGMISIGFVAALVANPAGANGLFYGGGFSLLGKQVIASIAMAVFAFVVTWIIATVITKTMGFRADPDDEIAGLDTTQHAESAYDLAGVAGGGLVGGSHPLSALRRRQDEEN
jgi:Amt family ammonium transporter